jgi:hypothetical protein
MLGNLPVRTVVVIYSSGIEGSEEHLIKMIEAGYPVKYLMASYLSLRKKPESIEKIKLMRSKYGVNIYLDSGAHALVYAEMAENKMLSDSWHPINKEVEEIKSDPDKYVKEYMDFLENNKDLYDVAVELDIQVIVGNDKVNEWREEFIRRGIPIMFVLHLRAGDNKELIEGWKSKGINYIGFGEIAGNEIKIKSLTKNAQDIGMKVHWFAYTPLDVFRKCNADTTDSTSWLAATKTANLYTHRGKQISMWNARENPLKLKSILKDDLFKLFDQKDFERRLKENKFFYFSFYSLKEIALWNEANNANGEKKYEKQLTLAEGNQMPLPAWAKEFDKMGRPKSIYLGSRYNATKHAVTAKGLHQWALVCHNCAINDKCPVASTDPENDLCFFLPHWRNLGEHTRNKEQLTKTLEDIVANDIVRLNYAVYQEQILGGGIDKSTLALQAQLAKELELLARFKGLAGNINVMNVDKQQINFGDMEKDLITIRNQYGEEFEQRVKKKLKEGEIVDGDKAD